MISEYNLDLTVSGTVMCFFFLRTLLSSNNTKTWGLGQLVIVIGRAVLLEQTCWMLAKWLKKNRWVITYMCQLN